MAISKYKLSHQAKNVHALRAWKEKDWRKEQNRKDHITREIMWLTKVLFSGETRQGKFKN